MAGSRDRLRDLAIPRRGFPRPDSRERARPLRPERTHFVLAAALAALTIAVYLPVGDLHFLNYDDNLYVVDNPRIAQGLSWDNAAWSATAFAIGNWHPVTLLSHMLDVTLFGLDAGAHHRMSLALHTLNVVFLFWLLAETTLQAWRAAFVAAFFAVHPLNVQTVAWISERKSLLSTAFWLLALIAYARDRKAAKLTTYLLMLAMASLALASKPMAVTLPLTFLLLDLWPLKVRPSLKHLAPVAALAVACGVLTLFAQRAIDAIAPVESYSLPVRLGNAVVSYAWYLKAMVWPAGLAAFYPHPLTGPGVPAITLSAVVLLGIFGAVTAFGRRWAPLRMGWWWYVATLLPVVGIIQVGAQSRADRYAYVPLIGIFIIVVWLAARWPKPAIVGGLLCIGAFSLVTRAQIPHWHDSVSLFQRAIDVVPDNAIAHNNLGMALVAQGRLPEALPHFQKSVELAPLDTDARSNLGNALRALGRSAEAVTQYQKALEQAPGDATIHYNLATALLDLGRADEAVGHLEQAVGLDPNYQKARVLLQRIEAQRLR